MKRASYNKKIPFQLPGLTMFVELKLIELVDYIFCTCLEKIPNEGLAGHWLATRKENFIKPWGHR